LASGLVAGPNWVGSLAFRVRSSSLTIEDHAAKVIVYGVSSRTGLETCGTTPRHSVRRGTLSAITLSASKRMPY
jgi:hypothetical protein